MGQLTIRIYLYDKLGIAAQCWHIDKCKTKFPVQPLFSKNNCFYLNTRVPGKKNKRESSNSKKKSQMPIPSCLWPTWFEAVSPGSQRTALAHLGLGSKCNFSGLRQGYPSRAWSSNLLCYTSSNTSLVLSCVLIVSCLSVLRSLLALCYVYLC